MKNFPAFLLFSLVVLLPFISFAQGGIKGYVYDSKGETLPYATIYIKELKSGTVANMNGYFEYPVKPGKYQVEFRHLGHKSIIQSMDVGKSYREIKVKLPENVLELGEVKIMGTREDPAFAIMRKAIAAARYYRMLVKAFDADVYIKGSGEVKLPGLIYKLAKSEGVDSTEYFVSETYSHIYYEFPNTYKQKIISARSNDKDSGMTIINDFVNASIYQEEFAGVISPLSSSAFVYYRFKLISTFRDHGELIHEIEVIPRSRGSQIFSGRIFIIEDTWNVYSFDLKTWQQGFEIDFQQMFAKVNEKMWFPVSQQFDLKGSLLGAEINYLYLTSMSEYKVILNDTLSYEKLNLIDEKTEKDYLKALEEEKKHSAEGKDMDTVSREEEQTYTLKDFKKEMKEHEKAARKQQQEPEVIRDYSMEVDSLAFSKNKTYWDTLRPIPLTQKEKKRSLTYKLDSIAVLKENDSLNGKGIFGEVMGGLIFGSSFDISKSWEFIYPSPLARLNFNTIEGFNLEMPLKLMYRSKKKSSLTFGPTFRYGFASEKLYTSGSLKYEFPWNVLNRDYFEIKGGTTVARFNDADPLYPFMNSLTSLIWIKNHMKIYEKTFISAEGEKLLSEKILIGTHIEWENRSPLHNNTTQSWSPKKGREYTSNMPVNIELPDPAFLPHKSFRVHLNLSYTPVLKYRKYNGKKIPLSGSYPRFNMAFTAGIPELAGSETHFQRLEGGILHRFGFFRNTLDLHVFAGEYLLKGNMYFPDFRHFQGNQTLLSLRDPMNTYSLLDYYTYSTSSGYMGGFARFNFSRFLLTRMFWLNITGVKEIISVNYLKTEHSPHYMELGYGLDNFLKLFRIEAYSSFEDFEYQSFGIRLGFSGSVQIN